MKFNGYEPGELRERKHRTRKADNGHSMVMSGTQRRGSSFYFTDIIECECGKLFTSRSDRAVDAYLQHYQKAVS